MYYHRILENAELEGTHQDHQAQLLDLYRTPQELHHVPENIGPRLLELVGLAAVTTSLGGLLQFLTTPWVKNLFLLVSLNLP